MTIYIIFITYIHLILRLLFWQLTRHYWQIQCLGHLQAYFGGFNFDDTEFEANIIQSGSCQLLEICFHALFVRIGIRIQFFPSRIPYSLAINAILIHVGKPQISLLGQSGARITTTWLPSARARRDIPGIYIQTWLGNSIDAEVIWAKNSFKNIKLC